MRKMGGPLENENIVDDYDDFWGCLSLFGIAAGGFTILLARDG